MACMTSHNQQLSLAAPGLETVAAHAVTTPYNDFNINMEEILIRNIKLACLIMQQALGLQMQLQLSGAPRSAVLLQAVPVT